MIKGRASTFGRLVIGDTRAAEAAVQIKTKVHKFGPLVTGTRVKPGTETPAPDSERVTAGMSLEVMEKVLKENPTFTVAFADSEFRRIRQGPNTGPRRGALRLFIEHADKGMHPDAAVVLKNRCEDYLTTGTDEELKALEQRALEAAARQRTTLSEARTGR